MNTYQKRTQTERTKLAIAWKFDLKKDYFSLEWNEITRLENLRKICGYDGYNYMGRSKSRQFWYYLQKGYTKLQKGVN